MVYERKEAVEGGTTHTIYDLVPTDREVTTYPSARNLHGDKRALNLLALGGLLRDADLSLGRSDQ
ncbi:MAG: hypothetical protein HY513_00625 [Candidatus Aenigmarchaeota archaeon]|nr:hypothetical protein [Candidatus Aenigmarchaeota archaeon]